MSERRAPGWRTPPKSRDEAVERIIFEAENEQATDDILAEQRAGAGLPGDLLRQAYPTVRRFGDACAELVRMLRKPTFADRVPGPLGGWPKPDLADRLADLLREVTVSMSAPVRGKRGRPREGWRTRLVDELRRLGVSRTKAREMLAAENLRPRPLPRHK